MSDAAPNTTNTNTNINTNTNTNTSTTSLHPELPTLTGTSVAPTATYSDQHGVSALDTRVFYDIDAEADIERISTIQSLCMNCREDGTTRLLVTRIPYFRDIVIMSFDCEHCGFRSSEMQPANEVAEKTVRYTLKVDPNDAQATKQDLNRQVIKSESCSIMIPELEFEIPPTSARGEINTVEGVLTNIADSLEAQQPNRELSDPAVAARIAEIIATFRGMAQGTKPFTFILDDLAGNSFLENPNAPNKDPRVEVTHRMRTRQENIDLGLQVEDETPEEKEQREAKAQQHSTNASQPQGITIAPTLRTKMLDTYFNVSDRVAIIPGTCQSCRADCETRMCITELPHFKDVVIMVTDCESCGYRDAEVKPAGSVSEKGTRITLKVEKSSDLARDLMKSETAGVTIPELELELDAGTLGGKYTTVEGLLIDIKSQLSESNPFVMGDSADYGLNDQKSKFAKFLNELERCISGERTFTLIVDDPLGNIYVYNPCAPNDDPQMKIEKYTRSFEQDEELGLNDINVDHYLDEEEQKQFDAEIAAEMEAAKLTLAQHAVHVDQKHKAEAALATVDERHIAVAAVAAGTGAIEGEEEADEWQKKAIAAGVNHRGWKPGGLITKEDEDRVAKMS